jgi:hypothetical protein
MPKTPSAYIFGSDPADDGFYAVTIRVKHDAQRHDLRLDLGDTLAKKEQIEDAVNRQFREITQFVREMATNAAAYIHASAPGEIIIVERKQRQDIILRFSGADAAREFREFSAALEVIAAGPPLMSPWPWRRS